MVGRETLLRVFLRFLQDLPEQLWRNTRDDGHDHPGDRACRDIGPDEIDNISHHSAVIEAESGEESTTVCLK
jgi:hypothetical protein